MEKYLFLIFIVLMCALPRICLDIVSDVSLSVNKDDDSKIVGGYNATIQQFPYQAFLSILKGFQVFQCGGSVINSQHILTAAHCAIGASMIRARVGSTYADRGGTQYTSFFFMIHHSYNPMTSDYDVAVVRVLRRMALDGTNVRAVKLTPANTPVAPGTKFIVSGWGVTTPEKFTGIRNLGGISPLCLRERVSANLTEISMKLAKLRSEENGNSSPTLMAVEVPVISSEECRKAYPITARMVCAGYPDGGKDSCQGDSGGPAVSPEFVQYGIVSFGKGCAQKGYPGVYTNVSSVREWIRQVSGA